MLREPDFLILALAQQIGKNLPSLENIQLESLPKF